MDTPVVQTLKLKDPSLLVEACLVGGQWIGEPAQSVGNPATGEIVARVPRFGAAEATRAVEAAEDAFRTWSKKLAK